MNAEIQTIRFDETVPRIREGSVRGRGLSGKDGGRVQAVMYPFDLKVPGLNFRFSYDRVADGFFSPRHRHNFDQFRYVVSGTVNIGKGVTLKQGECGYFPEGTFYGPQQQDGDGEALVVQFPGPQGAQFIGPADFKIGAAKLLAEGGIFENGIYQKTLEDGHHFNQDGFEAVWESFTGKPVHYVAPRYAEPVIMKPEGFRWVPDPKRPGLDVKKLGTFNEYSTSLSQWRLAPNTVLPGEMLAAPQLRFVIRGEVSYGGKQLPERSAICVPDGVKSEPLETRNGAEILVIDVPMYVASVWQQVREQAAAQA
jgi:mannose-6-phosphate isomerase-like protein (cupin superfamily)